MISRTVKYSLAILAIVVVALLVAPWFINVDRYKPRIASAIENATGRHVEIGEIHASLFPWIGVRLKNVSLDNLQGFSSRPFASIDDLDIKASRWTGFRFPWNAMRPVRETGRDWVARPRRMRQRLPPAMPAKLHLAASPRR
jgi:hypothetical protein